LGAGSGWTAGAGFLPAGYISERTKFYKHLRKVVKEGNGIIFMRGI
jgi:hypothetical protein